MEILLNTRNSYNPHPPLKGIAQNCITKKLITLIVFSHAFEQGCLPISGFYHAVSVFLNMFKEFEKITIALFIFRITDLCLLVFDMHMYLLHITYVSITY